MRIPAGGVSVSGGEPALQADFTAAFLRACREKGLHTALDTCGMCNPKALEKILPYANMVLFDVKFADTALHKQFTGAPNQGILNNLLAIRDRMAQGETPQQLWIRTPLIPGATATRKNIFDIGRFLASNLGQAFSRWELCAFNNLCTDKYTRLGGKWDFADTPLMTREDVDALESAAKSSGVNAEIVFATGATRTED